METPQVSPHNYIGRVNRRFADYKSIDRVCAAAYIYICCFNDIADTAVRDAIELVKKTPKYRHEVKRACRDALRIYDEYQATLLRTLGTRDSFWFDYADAYSEEMSRHVTNLRLAIHQRLLDLKEPSATIPTVAALITADVLLRLAVDNFRAYFDAMRKTAGIDLSFMFSAANLNAMQRRFRVVVEAFTKQEGDDVDFADNPRCALALKVIRTQMLSPELIDRVSTHTLRLNPEYLPEGEAATDLA